MDELNSNSQVFPEFDVTRDELLELARYWATSALEIEAFCHDFGTFGNREIHWFKYCWWRFDRIVKVLGDAEPRRILKEVKAKFKEMKANSKP